MEIKAITRKWGNPIAIVISRELVEKQHIHENEEMVLEVKRERPKAKELFGKFPELRATKTEDLISESRKGWKSASDRTRQW